MARAMALATEAGRTALLAGRLPQRAEARASSPLEGRVTNH
jgi:thiazole synthase